MAWQKGDAHPQATFARRLLCQCLAGLAGNSAERVIVWQCVEQDSKITLAYTIVDIYCYETPKGLPLQTLAQEARLTMFGYYEYADPNSPTWGSSV